MGHTHWQVSSTCPQCGKLNHVSVPVGERLVIIHCEHCSHSYDYLHVITNPAVIEDDK